MRMMLHEESVVALLSAILGSSALGGIGGWMAQKLKRYRHMVTSDDLKPIEEKLDKDYTHFTDIDKHLNALDRSTTEIMLINLRQCIFANPHDRNAEESILQSGEEYLRLGGNGVGHIRLNQVREDYAKRLECDDWDYTPGHHPGEGSES
ncbi:MAG: hypothetical protein L0L45_03425 [Bifidobacterium mongoliense]|uniref:hypothetical protein n=1 Tax=Bifidobacterium mongoliense TaxID=518643 RepID=UPI002648C91F|nr:hypothetical protein [Bifidobacterium mongoliense]MDN6768876.1 hypothetical protein [Bifidobacterium mongoliense]MDN6783479.1 hypothetical protein [Bifidobacterium mongoliense]MDN6802942.1 hypothetical protein [Bifidobacterium mongoliense]